MNYSAELEPYIQFVIALGNAATVFLFTREKTNLRAIAYMLAIIIVLPLLMLTSFKHDQWGMFATYWMFGILYITGLLKIWRSKRDK